MKERQESGINAAMKQKLLANLMTMHWQDAIDGCASTWRTEARNLIEQGKRFVMVNWPQDPDEWRACDALVTEFDYEYRIHLPESRAYVFPRNSGPFHP